MVTLSPTVAGDTNQTAYFLIILVYTCFMLFLLSCGATIYKSNNRREKFKLKHQILQKEYESKYDAFIKEEKPIEKQKIAEQLKVIAEDVNKLYSKDFYADLGDHFIAPITESKAASILNKLMFHTSIGRVLVNVESTLEKSILNIFQYMLSLQAVDVFRYYAARSAYPQQSMLAQFFGLLIGYVLFLLFNIMKEEYVRSRMGGDLSIIEKVD